MSIAIKAKTVMALGLGNVARVGVYRLGLRTGLGRVRRLHAEPPQGPFFGPVSAAPRALPASSAWTSEALYFGHHRVPLSEAPPDWFLNPLSQRRLDVAGRHWWQIPDFDPAIGDIKIIWEPSRFDWALAMAERAVTTGDTTALPRLEAWLADWCRANPPYYGPNWKCGQETSIRVMHLAVAALLLGSDRAPTPALRQLLKLHLKRIEPTIGYAIGQDNNHGTSEAAALFVGGTWLAAAGDSAGDRWGRLGRRLLENRIRRLIAEDGSFSQHSLTYHRVLLDTLTIAETWRRRHHLPAFSAMAQARLTAAATWLFTLIDPASGDGPNLGPNDGARLLPLTDTDYRDFRPTTQTAMALFAGRRAYLQPGNWDAPLAWLGLESPTETSHPAGSAQFDDGGYAVLRNGGAMALLRYPRFRFRPAQADALHVDLWLDGRNLLRDAGTFSYHAEKATLDGFAGTAGHNTVQFDGRDQMPRLGRFLFGEWLKADRVHFDAAIGEAAAGYTDWRGARHYRAIRLDAGRLTVRDTLAGQFQTATLRWRLAPGDWHLEGLAVSRDGHRLSVSADAAITRVTLGTAEESLYYLEKHPVPVLELEVSGPATLVSEYVWA